MANTSKIPSIAAIVVAAGRGVRARQGMPKQFAEWRGKPVIRHSIESFAAYGCRPIIVVIPKDEDLPVLDMVAGIPDIQLVTGGATRQDSVRAALENLDGQECERVFIHDAARPIVPKDVLDRLSDAVSLRSAAIPVLPIVDSLSIDENGMMIGTADRRALRRVQTPQAFLTSEIISAHREWNSPTDAGDDAEVFREAGGNVVHVEGDEALKKLTFADDFQTNIILPTIRIGMGYDVHRLVQGEDLWLGGIKFDYDRGLAGHSDADVALHAMVDAMLGAAALGDIGEHFPPSDPQWRKAASAEFVRYAVKLVHSAGYAINNIDLTIICEAPKIGPYRSKMRKKIAELLDVELERISVKATTTERLGFTGREEGIAVQAIATLIKRE